MYFARKEQCLPSALQFAPPKFQSPASRFQDLPDSSRWVTTNILHQGWCFLPRKVSTKAASMVGFNSRRIGDNPNPSTIQASPVATTFDS